MRSDITDDVAEYKQFALPQSYPVLWVWEFYGIPTGFCECGMGIGIEIQPTWRPCRVSLCLVVLISIRAM